MQKYLVNQYYYDQSQCALHIDFDYDKKEDGIEKLLYVTSMISSTIQVYLPSEKKTPLSKKCKHYHFMILNGIKSGTFKVS